MRCISPVITGGGMRQDDIIRRINSVSAGVCRAANMGRDDVMRCIRPVSAGRGMRPAGGGWCQCMARCRFEKP